MLKRMIVAGLDFYRTFISPLKPPSCRFYPTCSGYFRASVLRHGVWLGTIRGIRRLGRCHPWHPGGYDPVE